MAPDKIGGPRRPRRSGSSGKLERVDTGSTLRDLAEATPTPTPPPTDNPQPGAGALPPALLARINRPLVGQGPVGTEGGARLLADGMKLQTRRRHALASLARAPSQPVADRIQLELKAAPRDTWRRVIHITTRLIQLNVGAALATSSLSEALVGLLLGGRWAPLGEACQVMALALAQPPRIKARGESTGIGPVLAALYQDDQLLVLKPRLRRCKPEEFTKIVPLLLMLPRGANGSMAGLLDGQPEGKVRQALTQLLRRRGVDPRPPRPPRPPRQERRSPPTGSPPAPAPSAEMTAAQQKLLQAYIGGKPSADRPAIPATGGRPGARAEFTLEDLAAETTGEGSVEVGSASVEFNPDELRAAETTGEHVLEQLASGEFTSDQLQAAEISGEDLAPAMTSGEFTSDQLGAEIVGDSSGEMSFASDDFTADQLNAVPESDMAEDDDLSPAMDDTPEDLAEEFAGIESREDIEDDFDPAQLKRKKRQNKPAGAGDVDIVHRSKEDRKAAVEDVGALLRAVDKAVKMLNFYQGKGKNCDLAVGQAVELLASVSAKHGSLPIKITPYEFRMGEDVVWESEEEKKGLPFNLFKDGLRELVLMPNMPRDEFLSLMTIFRGDQMGQEENNTVTLLWESNPGHVRFRAADVFVEGLTDSDLGTSSGENIGGVLEVLKRPLVRKSSRVDLSRPGGNTQLTARRKQALELFADADQAEFKAAMKVQAAGVRTDFWRRAIHVASRMIQLDLGAREVAAMLSQVLEEMLTGRKWELLADTCSTIGAAMKQDQAKRKARPGKVSGLELVLAQLCAGGKLRDLSGELEQASPEQFEYLAEMIKVLPRDADDDLCYLLVNLPPGDIFDLLRALLEQRGVDLTELHVKNLSSMNLEAVIGAIKALQEIGTDEAVNAIPKVLGHPSARVRLVALKSVAQKVRSKELPEECIPDMISSLGSGYIELQELSFSLLEQVKRCPYGPQLLSLVKDETIKWQPEPRARALALLIKWGGSGVDEWVVDGVIAKSLLQRRKLDKARKELLGAITDVGGDRGRDLLYACRRQKMTGGIAKVVDQTLKKIK